MSSNITERHPRYNLSKGVNFSDPNPNPRVFAGFARKFRGFWSGDQTSRRYEDIPTRERAAVETIRRVEPRDYVHILKWMSHPQVSKHLDPLPELPRDWRNFTDVQQAVAGLADYYGNKGESKKILPLATVNQFDKATGVVTLRWRGDPYVSVKEGIVSGERLVVDPTLQGLGIGTTLMATAIGYAFYMYRGYTFRGAKEFRVWVMNDKQAQPWDRNYHFFRRLGFRDVPSSEDEEGREITPHWREYALQRGIPTDNRDAIWMQLFPAWYEARKLEDPRIKPCRLDL